MNSSIGLGTSAIGRPSYINIRTNHTSWPTLEAFKQNSIDVLNHAYNAGIRYFDTAPGYGFAESLLIDWLKEKNDTTIEVATKWGYSYVANYEIHALEHEVKEHSLAKLNEQWEVSKDLLPYLKYYQIHSATFETGVLTNTDILDRLYELKKQYNIKIGITSTGHNQVEVIKKALEVQRGGVPLFEVFQCTYNILDQSICKMGREIISLGHKLVVKEALANGRIFPNKAYPDYENLYQLLKRLSVKYKAGIDAIALRFCMQMLHGSTILSGASRTQFITENLQANTFELTKDELSQLTDHSVNASSYWEERKKLQWN